MIKMEHKVESYVFVLSLYFLFSEIFQFANEMKIASINNKRNIFCVTDDDFVAFLSFPMLQLIRCLYWWLVTCDYPYPVTSVNTPVTQILAVKWATGACSLSQGRAGGTFFTKILPKIMNEVLSLGNKSLSMYNK